MPDICKLKRFLSFTNKTNRLQTDVRFKQFFLFSIQSDDVINLADYCQSIFCVMLVTITTALFIKNSCIGI